MQCQPARRGSFQHVSAAVRDALTLCEHERRAWMVAERCFRCAALSECTVERHMSALVRIASLPHRWAAPRRFDFGSRRIPSDWASGSDPPVVVVAPVLAVQDPPWAATRI